MSDALPPLAVFDFDDTLVHGDSIWPFFVYVAGAPRVILAVALTLAIYAWRWVWDKQDPALADRGTFFKQQMLKRLIAGRRIESFQEPATRLRLGLRWNEKMRATLQEHYDQGHHVVIASGSLDLYLPELIKDLPHHTLLCTNIEISEGRATGIMSLGNCVRRGKAERIATYIAAHGPFGESWGYGNFPDDVPMMQLLRHRFIV